MIRRKKRTEQVEKIIYVIDRRVKIFLEMMGVIVGIPLIFLTLAFEIPLYLTLLGYGVFGVGFLATLTEGE